MEICQAFLLGIMFAYMPGMIVLAILLRFRTYGALVGYFVVREEPCKPLSECRFSRREGFGNCKLSGFEGPKACDFVFGIPSNRAL